MVAHHTFHRYERHTVAIGGRLNWLRAGVLGANDGIVSTAGVVAGVAGATSDLMPILTAGVAAAVAGSLSMAGGEYVSVSSQRDAEKATLGKERWELANLPEQELNELAGLYRAEGFSESTAMQAAKEVTARDPLGAHASMELGIDPDALTSPWAAAMASFVAFALGAVVPILAVALPPAAWRIQAAFGFTVLGLLLTGWLSARLGSAPWLPAVVRNVSVGILTMVITYGVGMVFGVTL